MDHAPEVEAWMARLGHVAARLGLVFSSSKVLMFINVICVWRSPAACLSVVAPPHVSIHGCPTAHPPASAC